MSFRVSNICQPLLSFLGSPFHFQAVSFSFVLWFFLGFKPAIFWDQSAFLDIQPNPKETFITTQPGFLKNDIGVDTSGLTIVEFTDEEGNTLKKAVPKKRQESLTYTVKSGDNISKIAHRFGLKTSTILWVNDLSSKQTLSIGQNLQIPPVDGIYHSVKSKETVISIAEKYGVETEKIQAYNELKNNLIKPKQQLFIPNGQKRFIAQVKTQNTTNRTIAPSTGTNLSSTNLRLIKPTQGILTQGYHKGHFAIDIANKKNTPIYAAASGTIIKESHTGWNYGYGRYMVIDHGNGAQTLYSHNNVNKVGVGEKVKQGQIIALMGNTGRVFGPTGVHLHFELRVNNRKLNPFNFFK